MPGNDEILTSLTLDTRAWIKHWLPEINENQIKLLLRYMKGLRIKEVDDYADYLSDQEEEVAFELAWQQHCYIRTREIDAE